MIKHIYGLDKICLVVYELRQGHVVSSKKYLNYFGGIRIEEQQEQDMSFDVDYYDGLSKNGKETYLAYLENYKEWYLYEPEKEELHGNNGQLLDSTQTHTSRDIKDINKKIDVTTSIIFDGVYVKKFEQVKQLKNENDVEGKKDNATKIKKFFYKKRCEDIYGNVGRCVAMWDGTDREILIPFRFCGSMSLQACKALICNTMNVICLRHIVACRICDGNDAPSLISQYKSDYVIYSKGFIVKPGIYIGVRKEGEKYLPRIDMGRDVQGSFNRECLGQRPRKIFSDEDIENIKKFIAEVNEEVARRIKKDKNLKSLEMAFLIKLGQKYGFVPNNNNKYIAGICITTAGLATETTFLVLTFAFKNNALQAVFNAVENAITMGGACAGLSIFGLVVLAGFCYCSGKAWVNRDAVWKKLCFSNTNNGNNMGETTKGKDKNKPK